MARNQLQATWSRAIDKFHDLGKGRFMIALAWLGLVKVSKFLMMISGAAALAMLAAVPVRAEDPAPKPAAKAEGDDGTLNKVVCRRVEAIGTRLSSKKVCRTQAQWDAEASANRQDLERSQTQRWKSD